jgi:ornithine--oxo-acid transaminase
MYPVSVVLAGREILGLFEPGDHGSTFGGNPLACAVAREALNVLTENGLIERAAELGDHLRTRLDAIQSPHIKQIRGKGLLIGIVLKPEAGGARRFCEALMARGLLCKETHWNVIRLAPPLIVTRPQIDWAVERLDEVLQMP